MSIESKYVIKLFYCLHPSGEVFKGTGAWNFFFGLIYPSGRERKDLQFFSWWACINWDVLSFPSFFTLTRNLHIRREQTILKDNQKFIIFILFLLRQYLTLHLIFSKYCPCAVPRHLWKWKFLSAHSLFFLRIRRIRRKYLSVHEEYSIFRVVCATQFSKLSRRRGKNLCLHGKDTKLRIPQLIMVQLKTFLKTLILSVQHGLDLAKIPFHATVPLNILKTWNTLWFRLICLALGSVALTVGLDGVVRTRRLLHRKQRQLKW
jgi:hypothetical protein